MPTDAVPDLLRELIGEVQHLRRAVERQRQSRPLSRKDIQRWASLAPAISEIFADELFTSQEVTTHPRLQILVRGLSRKTIGRLLARLEQLDVDGLSLERVGKENGSALWRLRTVGLSGVSDGQKPQRRS